MQCTPEELLAISKDSKFHDLGVLPSNNVAYKGRMDKLFIRPFQLPELQLLSRAAELNEVSHLIRAVDNCISHPIADITIGDFYYILLWLRIYSMPKAPYLIEWDCHSPYFINKETRKPLLYTEQPWPNDEILLAQYDISECKMANVSSVHMTSLEVISLEEGFELPEGFDFPRVAILEDMNAALEDPSMTFITPSIQWIKGDTWADKVAAAAADVSLVGEGMLINRRVTHGISEEATFFCGRCRIKHTTKLKLNALTFFR